jgi:hypothetical protein
MIFGTNHVKFISGAATVEINHCVMTPIYAQRDIVEHTSVINGKRNYISLGDYAEFEVMAHLHRYTLSAGGFTPASKFIQLWGFRNALVDEFFPHANGLSIIDTDGNLIPFQIVEMTPAYLENIGGTYDVIRIVFRSTKYVDLGKIAVDNYQNILSEDGSPILTEDGLEIIV